MKMSFDSGPFQKPPTALLIPGIGISYAESIKYLKDESIFQNQCVKAGIDHFINTNRHILEEDGWFLQDSLINQKIAYVVNCSMGDICKERGILPEFILGYSMGINVALYTAGHCSFETGLEILEKEFDLYRDHCSSQRKRYGMALILGLKEDEIRELLFKEAGQEIDIAIYSGKRNFVIGGEKEVLDLCINKALEAGAVSAKPILTEHPYHTALFKAIAQEYRQYLRTLNYSVPSSKILSLTDGTMVVGESEVIDLMVQQTHLPLHFDLGVERLIHDYKISAFYEIGPADSMRKLIRYINREVKVHRFLEEEVQ
jgi:[acyl-carrier-protein] S-malonyltransferase